MSDFLIEISLTIIVILGLVLWHFHAKDPRVQLIKLLEKNPNLTCSLELRETTTTYEEILGPPVNFSPSYELKILDETYLVPLVDPLVSTASKNFPATVSASSRELAAYLKKSKVRVFKLI